MTALMTGLLWGGTTLLVYVVTRALHRRYRYVVFSPLLVGPAALVAVLLALHVPYGSYAKGSRFLVDLLGPTTVAFAVPLYQHRALLRRHARELGAAVAVGSIVAVASSVELARWLRLDAGTTLSMAPRSVTTPFAMDVAQRIGGTGTLAAVFVIITALVGLVVGELLLRHLPLRSEVARGAMFGMGAHGAGAARAMELGLAEGAIAAVVMVFAGLLLVTVAPALRFVLCRPI